MNLSKITAFLLIGSILNLSVFNTQLFAQSDKHEQEIKAKVATIGTNQLVKVTLLDGTKISGNTAAITDTDFGIVSHNHIPRTISYSSVKKIKKLHAGGQKVSTGKAKLATLGLILGLIIIWAIAYRDEP